MSALLLTLLLLLPPRGEGLEAQLQRPELQGARVAVAVVDLASGERLFARNLDMPLAPASNMKLLTAAAALTLLGPDYQFATRLVAAQGPDAHGVLQGDLIVLGGADPTLRSTLLAHERVADPAELLVDLAQIAGVRRVLGRLVIDDGLLDHEWVHPDWPAADTQNTYGAPIGALSLHGNCVDYAVDGGGSPSVRLLTHVSGYRVANELKLADKSSECSVGALQPDAQGLIRVSGKVGRAVGQRTLRVPVRDPSDYAGRCLLAEAEARGLAIEGGLAFAPGLAHTLPGGVVLQTLESPLVNAIAVALKESDNSISDHLFKLMGVAGGAREGSFESGARAVQAFLGGSVATPLEGVVLRDGSGLSPNNRVTARLLTDTLVFMDRAPGPVRDAFLRSLPVSGYDGSLEERLTEAPYRGAVRAKTGFISGVSTLSGYVLARSGRTFSFAILINDFSPKFTNKQMKAIQDSICRALVDRF